MRKIVSVIIILFSLSSCSTAGRFGTGVDITFDPRTIGMQIDDTIMQKNLVARLALTEKKYFLLQVEVIDGRIFLTGKVNDPEEKIKITKLAWEDILITSQLRSALIFNKKTKARNYTLETIDGKVYIFGIAMDKQEKKEVIDEANKIYDVQEVIPSIYLVSELSRSKF